MNSISSSSSSSSLSLSSSSKKSSKTTAICFIFCFIALLLLAICIGAGYKKYLDRTRPELSLETNETFFVQNNETEPDWVGKEVARRLGRLAVKGDQVVAYMEQHKLPDAEIANRLSRRWQSIRKNPKGLRETGRNEKSAAYTVNKGEELRICIRNEKSDKLFEEENTGFLVLLHELAHLMTKGYDNHNEEFHKCFAFITKIAVQLGLYQYVNYQNHPTNYCGTDITQSPI
jgi:preprotein translocase subunit SecG